MLPMLPGEPPLLFIDFEASSLLPGTFPVEVGWVGDGVPGESHLIHPGPFEGWGDWSYESEAIHGISQDMLRSQGQPAEWVARRFLKALQGRQGVVGSITYDSMWLVLLLEVIGGDAPRLLSEETALHQAALTILEDASAARVCVRAAREARLGDIVYHRALPDAESSFRLYRTVVELAEARKASR